ncbi:MAG TPA: DUF6401 family natural product biosynthesis protein [Kribbella sp.]
MTSEFNVTANSAPASAPEALLEDIMASVGVDGLLAAMGRPGLMAAVDQHAAAIRDSLASSGLKLEAGPLAGYASSVAAASVRMGHELPDPATMNWSKASWFQLRLMAVCALAITNEVL